MKLMSFRIKQGDSLNRIGFKLLQSGKIDFTFHFDLINQIFGRRECVLLKHAAKRDFHVTLDGNDKSKASLPSGQTRLVLICFLKFNLDTR